MDDAYMALGLISASDASKTIGEFARRIFGPSADDLGLIISDHVRLWRLRNLISISRKFDRICREKGIDLSEGNHLKLAVGLPLIEKASYQDDDFLQARWAHLIASSLRSDDEQEIPFSLNNTYVEVLHQLSRLDCEVLEFIVEKGVEGRKDGNIIPCLLEPDEIAAVFPESLTHISLEKLVSLGCVSRDPKLPLKPGGSRTLMEVITPTIIGINFYIAASGKLPKWFHEESTE